MNNRKSKKRRNILTKNINKFLSKREVHDISIQTVEDGYRLFNEMFGPILKTAGLEIIPIKISIQELLEEKLTELTRTPNEQTTTSRQ